MSDTDSQTGLDDDLNCVTSNTNAIQLENEFYQPYEFFQMNEDFTKVDPQSHKVAVAKYGGPIAVGRDKNQIVVYNSDLKDAICFYSNEGEKKNQIDFKCFYDTNKDMVCFDYIEDELLFILANDGQYYLLNPYKDQIRTYQVSLLQDETIVEGKTFHNGFVFLTNQGKYHAVHNVFEPQLKSFPVYQFQKLPRDWIIINPEASYSGRLEVHAAHMTQGILVFIEDEQVQHFFGNQENRTTMDKKEMPIINNVVMMCQTFDVKNGKDRKLYSYLTKVEESWRVWVISSDFQQLRLSIAQETPIDRPDGVGQQLKSTNASKPSQMLWCGLDCVILSFKNSYMNIGPNRFGIHQKQNAIYVSEVDGVRILSKKRNEIFRRQPYEYTNLTNLFGTTPGCKLRDTYHYYKSQQPNDDNEEDIKSKKTELAEGVKECIISGIFELKSNAQTFFLKAASYGKTFLNSSQIDHDSLYDKCKFLRVVHNINKQNYKRTLTYQQAANISEETLIKILLRYNLHHLAFEVCNYLNFEKKELLVPMIYEHWACQKVEQDESDIQLQLIIKDKLADQQGLSYTEIAHKAIEIGKPDLALKLLELEPDISKRVPVLLSMCASQTYDKQLYYYEKALQEALDSRESNFINMVILDMITSGCDQDQVYNIIQDNRISNQHFISYLLNFDNTMLDQYLQRTGQYYVYAMIELQKAGNSQFSQFMDKHLKNAQRIFKEDKNCAELNQIVNIWQHNLEIYKLREQSKGGLSKGPEQINAFNYISHLMGSREIKESEVQKEAKSQHVNDKTVQLLKVRELVSSNRTVELSEFLQIVNKKKQIIPYDVVADLYMQQDDRYTALQFLEKIPDLKEKIHIFMSINEPQKAIDSILKSNKGRSDKRKYLENLKQDCYDPEINHQIQQEIEALRSK